MDTTDWVKVFGVGILGWYVGNKVTGGELKRTAKKGMAKLNELVNDKKVIHGGIGAATGVYAGSKLKESEVAKDVGIGAGTGGLLGYFYGKNKEKINGQVSKYFTPNKSKPAPETPQ